MPEAAKHPNQTNPQDPSPVHVNVNLRGDDPESRELAAQPLQVTAEAYAKSQPEEAQKLREAAQKEERERVAALQAAFGGTDDAEFLTKAIAEGWSLTQAKAEHHDVLAERIETQTQSQNVPGFAATDRAPNGDAKGGPIQQWNAAVGAKMNDARLDRSAAVRAVCREQPELREAYVEAYNAENHKRRSKVVAR